ncbi:MAG: glycerate kinase [Candidatus Nanopelagicales bacterium]
MRVLIVPDSFTGTMSASAAATAISTGWQLSAPHDEITALAISDGGPGFVDAVLTNSAFSIATIEVLDLLGQTILINAAVSDDPVRTYFFESAQIVGSHLVLSDVKKPDRYTSFGIGQAIKFAINDGAKKIVIGLGGTASIDAGAGMLAALGAEPADQLTSGGNGLKSLRNLNLTKPIELMEGVELIVAADVDVPLLGPRGAVQGFGAQKGATPEIKLELEAAIGNFRSLIPMRPDGKDPALMLGAGAAGGIGFAALAIGARKEAGFEFVATAMNLVEQIAAADLIITGEGKFDWQSMQGKAISQLAQLCLSAGKPLLVLAGQVDVGRREWSAIGVVGTYGCSVDGEIPANPAQALSDLATRVARTFSPTSWQN